MTAKEATIEEATRFLGVAVPPPDYLLEGYLVQDIYTQDDAVKIYVAENPIEKRIIRMGDAGESRQQHVLHCKMGITINWHPEREDIVRAIGESTDVGKYQGVVIDREQHYQLWWLMPGKSGQYEIILAAGK